VLPEAVAALRCPLCLGPLTHDGRALRCAAGHAFDVARQGYVSFLSGKPSGLLGDDAAMVDARARFLAAGHFDPLAREIVAAAGAVGDGLVVEVGAGTAWYLARVLDARPGRAGLALDLSRFAARRAARAHPRAASAAADVRAAFPIGDRRAAIVLDVFAPRNGAEFRRILRDDGLLIVVTPAPEHLAELRAALGLLDVDPQKERRVADSLSPFFVRASSRALRWTMELPHADALALALMGPSARHRDATTLAVRVRTLAEPALVTGACVVETWRPHPPPGR
jgi:23S rRNA (guanine745-N1)-methyltransferase